MRRTHPTDLQWIQYQRECQQAKITPQYSVYLNRKHQVPDQFDWIAYRSLNSDLSHIMTYIDAIKHYKQHGQFQSRSIAYESTSNDSSSKHSGAIIDRLALDNELTRDIPLDFDWIAYRSLNSDLKHIGSLLDAIRHYRDHGRFQSRAYNFTCETESTKPPHHEVQTQEKGQQIEQEQVHIQGDVAMHDITPVILPKATIQVPTHFDWMAYRALNPDLAHLSGRTEAIRHYCQHGYNQNRPICFPTQPIIKHTRPLVKRDLGSYDGVVYEPYQAPPPTSSITKPTLPQNFNWTEYRQLNPDLSHLKSRSEAVNHYLEHGHSQSRPYRIESDEIVSTSNVQLPKDFNWIVYGRLNADLPKFLTQRDAEKHYLRHGHLQQRPYSLPSSTLTTPTTSTTLGSATIPTSTPHLKHKNHSQNQAIQHGQLPKDFNWRRYLLLNQDLNHLKTEKEAQKHYLMHGIKDSRPYQTNFLAKPMVPIPNIIHFIYGFAKQTEPFELYKYLAIESAIRLNQPDRTYFHYYYEPFGEYWDVIKSKLHLNKVIPPTEFKGQPIRHFAHQSDVVRLQMLNQLGGIYFDIDTLCLQPLTSLRYSGSSFIMSRQGDFYGLCNAIMMAQPQSEFGQMWLQMYQNFRGTQGEYWDEHSVRLPLKLATEFPNLIQILPTSEWFYPLWDPTPEILLKTPINPVESRKILSKSSCLHLWESYTSPELKLLTPELIQNENTLYNWLARRFLSTQTISIVALTYNRPDSTLTCLTSWMQYLNRPDIKELIIWDNGSTDDKLLSFLHEFETKSDKIKVIYSPENLGVCGGRLQLFALAKGDIICSLDSDLEILSNDFFNLVQRELLPANVGMIGCSGAQLSKSFRFGSHRDLVSTGTTLGSVTMPTLVECDTLAGCCQVFRRQVSNLGVELDAKFGQFWVEDTDFSLQIREKGLKLLAFSPNELVRHTWGGSGNASQFTGLYEANWAYLVSKWSHRKDLCSLI